MGHLDRYPPTPPKRKIDVHSHFQTPLIDPHTQEKTRLLSPSEGIERRATTSQGLRSDPPHYTDHQTIHTSNLHAGQRWHPPLHAETQSRGNDA